MDRLLQKLTKEQSKYQHTDKKSILLGTIIGVCLAASPYLFYLYEGVPDAKIWDTFLFSYESNFYGNVNTAMWVLTGKVIPLIFLLLWFFTNRNWWYHALLGPIVMYVYQIFAFFKDDVYHLDELQLFYMVPVMAILIPSIYLIRAKMFNKINDANKSMKELEEEFMVKPKGIIGHLKQYF